MNKTVKYLLFVFVVLFLAKSVFSLTIPAPHIWSDEYMYAKMAQGIFYDGEISVHGVLIAAQPPLYPLALSPAYFFSSMAATYKAMKIINSLISSLIMFPVFFLAREVLNRKRALLCAAMAAILPASFSFSPYLMAENLFFPLFMLTMFFLYKARLENSYKFCILAGISTGLLVITKIIGLAMLPLPLLAGIYFVWRNHNAAFELKQLAAYYLPAVLVVLPWIIIKGKHIGYAASGQLGAYAPIFTTFIRHKYFFQPLVAWIMLYAGYVVLATGVVFAVYAAAFAASGDRKTKLLFGLSALAMFFFILAAANSSASGVHYYSSPFKWFTERPVGRYVDMLLPLVLILGFKGFEMQKDKGNGHAAKLAALFSLLLAFSAQLTIAPLFPLNNLSLSYLGAFKYLLEFLLFGKASFDAAFSWQSFLIIAAALAAIPIIFFALHKRLKFSSLFIAALIFFLAVNALNYAIAYERAAEFSENEQMQLGRWLAENGNESVPVFFDSRDSGVLIKTNAIMQKAKEGHFVTITGFWLKNKIGAWDGAELPENVYIISRQALEANILKDFNGLRLYKTS